MAAAVQRSLVSRDVAQFAALPSKAKPLSRVHTRAARIPAVKCTYDTESSRKEETVSFREFGRSLLAATAVMCGAADLLFMPPEAMADLNKFEANVRGEFGIGSAAQYGAADLRYEDRLSFHPPFVLDPELRLSCHVFINLTHVRFLPLVTPGSSCRATVHKNENFR